MAWNKLANCFNCNKGKAMMLFIWQGQYGKHTPQSVILHTSFPMKHTTDDVVRWKHFPRYWPFVQRIHRLPVNSPHKGQWCGILMFSLICTWTNSWVNNWDAGDLRHHRIHYNVTVMYWKQFGEYWPCNNRITLLFKFHCNVIFKSIFIKIWNIHH